MALWHSRTIYPSTRYYYYNTFGPYTVPRTDAEIADDVKESLRFDTWVDSDKVDIDVSGGMVTLSGTVDTITAKRSAGDDAFDTPGVTDVINQIQVSR